MKILDTLAIALLLIGGLNWGLVGLMNVNLVSILFGDATMAARTVYGLVGLSAVYQFVTQFMLKQSYDTAENPA